MTQQPARASKCPPPRADGTLLQTEPHPFGLTLV
jgi:hypothetical protein